MQNNLSYKLSRIFTQLAIFLIPFYFLRFSIGPVPTNIFEAAVLLALLSTICYLLSSRTKIIFGSSIWPYLFLLVSLISVFPAGDKIGALGIFKGWFLTPVILYLLIINLFSSKDWPKLLMPLFAGLIVIDLWTILQSLGVVTTLFYQKDDPTFMQYFITGNFRLFGPFESPNYLAMYLVPVFFLTIPAVYYFRKISPKYYWLAAIPFGFAANALLFSDSRAGMLAMAAPIAIVLFSKIREIIKRNPRQGQVAVILILIALSVFYLNYRAIATNRSESDSSRVQIWRYSLQIGAQQPLLGIGLGSFQDKVARVSEDDVDFIDNVLPYAIHPHNVYLAMWLNVGILGLIVFIVLIKDFFRSLWSRRSELFPVCLMAAMAAIVIHGLFDTTYFKNDLSAIFWLIIALAEVLDVRAVSQK